MNITTGAGNGGPWEWRPDTPNINWMFFTGYVTGSY